MTLAGVQTTIRLDKKDHVVTFKLDGRPEFSLTVGDLNKLLSRTCDYVVGVRCHFEDKNNG